MAPKQSWFTLSCNPALVLLLTAPDEDESFCKWTIMGSNSLNSLKSAVQEEITLAFRFLELVVDSLIFVASKLNSWSSFAALSLQTKEQAN